jgi:hypothetical protein
MALISRKKRVYPPSDGLRDYLEAYGRMVTLPIHFEELGRYQETVSVYDKHGRDTLWETVLYGGVDRERISKSLVATYADLKVMGDMSLMKHLVTERVDVCTWGNTKPYRVRILNTLNENFDYFYIKKADASRIYGLELEHILAPSRIEFLCDGDTVVEQHVSGIPARDFIKDYLTDSKLDEVRLAKEFVKFNERCLLRLLGDMHAGNFVVDITPDFDETVYSLRAIDFDQQSYDGRCHVYLPQYYKVNNPLVFLSMRCMTEETYAQYRNEERTLMGYRAKVEKDRLEALLESMCEESLAPRDNVLHLRADLAAYHNDQRFASAESMGDLVRCSLALLA